MMKLHIAITGSLQKTIVLAVASSIQRPCKKTMAENSAHGLDGTVPSPLAEAPSDAQNGGQ